MLAVTVALVLTPAAGAAPLTGASYDAGDGDQKNQGSTPNDWQALNSLSRVTSYHDPNGADSTYIGGTKEEQPSRWAFSNTANGVTPGKSNVLVGWSALEPTASTSFLYLGFKRAGTTGNSFLTFELNQRFSSWRNSVGTTIPCRTDGDLLVAWQAGSPMVMKVYRWLGSGGPPSCPDGAFGTFTGSTDVIAGGYAQGAINASNSQKDNYLSPTVYGSTFPINAFGEAAINLPAVLSSMGTSPCAAFVSLQVHSRSSEQISSALQDYVAAQPMRVQSCSVSGTKFNDLDADGVRDAGEPGLGGWRFYLDLDNDDQRDAGEPTAVTDADGSYHITDVLPGTYTVREEPTTAQSAAGWTCSFPSSCEKSVTQAASGGNTTGHDFGNWEPARVTGTKFQDTNRNGVRDYGERGLPDVTIFADANGNAILDASERSAVTAADGTYSVGGIRPGTYAVRELSPAGHSCTAPGAGSACAYAGLALTSGQVVADRDFGNAADATVAGRVFRDRDASGTDDSDPGLLNWTVYVDYNASGTRESGEPFTTTDSSGAYVVSAVNAGTYRVRVQTQDGWTCLAPVECSYSTPFTAGSAATGRDFGAWQRGTVSGTKFSDADRDGVMDAGEAGMTQSFTIYVDYDGDQIFDVGEPWAASGVGGAYTISNVRPGTWSVHEHPPVGWLCTADCGGQVTVSSGTAAIGPNVGNVLSTTIWGYKFEDTDADGFRDDGEPGLAGWRIYVDLDGDDSYDTDEPSAVTKSDGSYIVADVPDGEHRARFVPQDGWACTYNCEQPVYDVGNSHWLEFGSYRPGSASGTYREDIDADGSPLASGDGLGGFTVYADADEDGEQDPGEPSATTTPQGNYTVPDLAPGRDYVLRVAPRAGWTCSQPASCTRTVNILSGGTAPNSDFAGWRPATVSGQKFEDRNRDGAWSVGEFPLGGVRIYVDVDGDGSLGSGEPSALTSAADGAYTIAGIRPRGTTQPIREVLEPGYVCTAGCSRTVVLSSGDFETGLNVGNSISLAASGTKFEDADADGVKDTGEPGVAGVTVYVDYDGDSSLDAGEPSAVTADGGAYAISGIRAGTYTIREVGQSGWTCSLPSPCSYRQTFEPSAEATGRDFGAWRPASASGLVYEDADRDGTKAAGESGLGGYVVYADYDGDEIRDADEPSTTSATSATIGSYGLTGIRPGSYTIRQESSAGYVCVVPSGCGHAVSLGSNGSVTGKNFGNATPGGSVEGLKFGDHDADGSRDAGEPGLSGFTIFVDYDGDAALDAGEPHAVSGSTGDYRVDNVNPGTWTVREVQQAGWTCSAPAGCAYTSQAVAADAPVSGRDFGNYRPGSISGMKFNDLDHDGVSDAGEPELAGTTIYVDSDLSGTFTLGEPSAVTDIDGSYTIAGLSAGTYTVREITPAGWTCSAPVSCVHSSLTVGATQAVGGKDFGNWTEPTISGQHFEDLNGNGEKDAGEPGVAGVTVYADANTDGDGSDSGEGEAVTAADGGYQITGLTAGTAYRVREVAQAGWTCATPSPCEYDETLTASQIASGRDFGSYRPAQVAGIEYEDSDGDGTRDAGEPPLQGWRVYVDRDGDAQFDAAEPASVTGADGTYSITGLTPDGGTYDVRHEPTGAVTGTWSCSEPASGCERSFTVVSNASQTGDFGSYRKVTIAGQVYGDTDGDGAKDSGENGLQGWTVKVDPATPGDATDDLSVDTGAGGAWSTSELDPGITYRVQQVAQAGHTCTQPVGCEYVVPTSSGDGTVGGRDFGNFANGRITVRQAVSPGESATTGTAFDFTPGTGIGGGAFVLRDTGEQSWTLAPGAYTVDQAAEAGYAVTDVACAGDGDSAGSAANRRATFRLTAGEDVTCTFSSEPIGSIEIEQRALPAGAAGSFDFTAAGLPGTADDTFALAHGEVKTVPVTSGTYDVDQVARTGFTLSSLSCSDGSTTWVSSRKARIDVAAGETVRCIFTNIQRASVTVRKATSPAESTTAGTEFELSPGAGLESGALRLRHDGTRTWSVAPGTYTVDETGTSGYELTGVACAGDDDSSGDTPAGRATFRLGAGESATCTFTSTRNVSIAGTSFEDADADGQRDPGESGERNFSVYLDLDDDGTRDDADPVATSGADGSWRFEGLPAGSYRVRQAARDGWTCSLPSGCAHEVDLGQTDAAGRDFGAWRTARIVGTVFEDVDRDGTRDSGEPARSRRTLYLDADGDGARDGEEQSVSSGADGTYSFEGLRPGTWIVREALPDGWHCSAPDPCGHTVALRSGGELSGRDFGSWREPEPAPPVEPAVPRPPTIGPPTLSPGPTPEGAEDPTIGRERDPDTGGDIYLVPRTGPCLPLQLDIPIDAEPGSVLEVRLVFRPAGGGEEKTIVLADTPPEPADGVWSGTIECARDGDLELIVKTADGETKVPVGEIILIDPSGTIYDADLYASLAGDGANPEAARCGSALSGATVTLQRRVGAEFETVAADDRGMAPNINPQESDADGSYRWDVSAGEYRVRVLKDGYHPTVSRTVSVPPPVLDLHVAMTRRPGTPAPAVRECGKPEQPEMDADDGCVSRPVNARVRGRRIRQVVFYLDGRKLRTVSRPDGRGRFGVTVQRRTLSPGKHVLRAKVVFKRSAKRRPAWLRLPIERCLTSVKPKALEATPRPGCGTKPFLAWVRGDRIRRVAFMLDGRRLRTVSVADWRGRYGATVDPTDLPKGKHVVMARIEFVKSSGLRAQTVRLPFTKCP